MKQLSRELAQPVTSFIVARQNHYEIRWFAGDVEINLCGHGSLAAAATIFAKMPDHDPVVTLANPHGTITITTCASGYTMTMPSWEPERNSELKKYTKLLGLEPVDIFGTRDLVLVLDSEEQVRRYTPDFDVIKNISDYHAMIITAQQGINGYVLRYFAPGIGIDEDIATGSAQCSLAPYWSQQLSETTLAVTQLSHQGGYFLVTKCSDGYIDLTVNVELQKVVELGVEQKA